MNRPLSLALSALVAWTALLAGGCRPHPEADRFKRVMTLLKSENQDDRAAGAERAGRFTRRSYVKQIVPILIEFLDPAQEVNPWASLFAAGSLETLTAQDFGSERRSGRW